MIQTLPIGSGSLAVAQGVNEPRIRPTSAGGALCEPWTPTNVSAYSQTCLPEAMSKQRNQLWSVLYSPDLSTSRPSAEPSPSAGILVGFVKSYFGAPQAV